MWSPVDIHSLPTNKDRIHAIHAIKELEIELEAATVALLQAQQHLDNLKIDLLKRRAWLAPIRILPNEVLSLIFTQYAEERWRAPLLIQGVCRLWRDIVRHTPEAWSFIPWVLSPHSLRILDFIWLFASRSGNTPQHIVVPLNILEENREQFARLEEHVMRATHMYSFNRKQYHFPKLQRLKIRWNIESWRVPEMDIAGILDNAPNLNALSLLLDPKTELTAMVGRTSNVEHLELHVRNPLKILDLLQACSRGLKTLILSYDGCQTTPQPQLTPLTTMHFPRLQGLYLNEIIPHILSRQSYGHSRRSHSKPLDIYGTRPSREYSI